MSIIGSNILAGASGQAGYNLNNSLRFRSSASAYLSRTFGTPTTTNVWTWSCWVKRGTLGANQTLMDAGDGVGTTQYLLFNSSDQLYWNASDTAGNNIQNLYTTAVFRDPSAWYHIVAVFNTPSATSTSRAQLYVNGVLQTVTYILGPVAQNATSNWNKSGALGRMGKLSYASAYYLDGYMAELNFVDGQALTPSSFGETSTTTGSWIPKKYTGTYGTNGFYLKFSDIATTSGSNAGLGKDFSGNANYFNTNNISVTAGVTYDAMLDVPTNTSATVGNYPTLNPLNPFKPYVTLSNANLTATGNTSVNTDTVYSTMGSLSTSIYWEYTCVATVGSAYGRTGAITIFPTAGGGVPGEAPLGGFGWRQDGYLVLPSGSSLVLPTFTTNDVLGYALNPTAGTCALYKNGTLSYTVTGLSTTSTFFPATAEYNGSVGAFNFGQRPFIYTAPSGFVALNTYNLPTPTILQGNKYMDATLYTGNSGVQTVVNNAQFKPDFVWMKDRSNARNHVLSDSVRGTASQLESNTTAAQTTYPNSLTAFNSNGFTLGDDTRLNNSAETYVGWQWQAGQGTTSSNTSGSITSTVSVNATAGFSVVTYTGTGANATVGHGLGVAPKWIIVKRRSAVDSWVVYNQNLTSAAYILELQTTGAQANVPSCFNSTAPTSTVFSVGTNTGTNGSASTYVAYCWAEIAGYSKFGSYTGNGSTDGPFVFTGFRPKFILCKKTSDTSDWILNDTSRDTFNVTSKRLFPSDSGAESGTYDSYDILSNGFKMRNTNSLNISSASYIFMAFAENPFKNANAR